jgi:hypothetical protein
LTAPVASTREPEKVARFVFDRDHLLSTGARWKAFEPSRRDNTTSVFVVDGLDRDAIWELADTTRVGQQAVADAELSPLDVREIKLRLEIDNDPPRHAAIVDWPAEKAQIKAMAQALAARARVFRRA